MPERTQKEIDAEIKALEECKTYIPHFTAFNDDNYARVDLQIEELRGEIDEDESSDEWNERSNDDQSTILEARNWKNGESDESPSSGWEGFKPKQQKPAKRKKK